MAIIGSLASLRRQVPAPASFERAFAYLAEVLTPGSEARGRILALEAGKSERVELGFGLHAMEQAYRTRQPQEGRFESHRAHLDVQLLVSGQERVAVAETCRLDLDEDLTPGKDVIFYRPAPAASELLLVAGDAAVLFPSDAHLPGLFLGQPMVVHKTVVKVPVG